MTSDALSNAEATWTPPFCTVDTDLTCPGCRAEKAVRAREQAHYADADAVEAYCAECHAELEVYATVDISFSDPEVR